MPITVKFLPKAKIEQRAHQLLADYGKQFGEVLTPPIPVEEILENHLRLTFEIDNLAERLGHPDVLGALWAADRIVAIDESLEPTENPHREGRFRYTVGHEIGHWVLHRHYFLDNPDQGSLFQQPVREASVVCRASKAKDRMEWQADYFAATLLMPDHLVSAAWKKLRGTSAPFVLDSSNCSLVNDAIGTCDEESAWAAICEQFAGELAPEFKVSKQATQIRLVELGYLRNLNGGLFSSAGAA